MTTTIAVAGKGGTGKTLMAALLIQHILERRLGTVLAIDADPATNLHLALDVSLEGTVGDLREETLQQVQQGTFPAGMSKNDYLDYQLRMLLVEAPDFDLLAMGRPEGPGCYCAVNNLLRLLIDRIARRYDYVVIDNEAGMEHLSRRTTRDVDLLLLISDSTVRGVITAAQMAALARRLEIRVRQTRFIVNMITDETLPPAVEQAIRQHSLELLGLVPRDPLVAQYDAEGKPFVELPKDAPVRRALNQIAARLDSLVR